MDTAISNRFGLNDAYDPFTPTPYIHARISARARRPQREDYRSYYKGIFSEDYGLNVKEEES